jgi:dihydrofolate reductase
MRRVRYSVAMSLDGFIAGPQGEADWIEMDSSVDIAEYFRTFYAQFDTAVMGRRSYDIFGGAVEGMDTYVLSTTLPPGHRKGVTVVGDDGLERVRELRAGEGKDIWLFGGGALFGSLSAAGLVDSIELAVMPVLLGSGVPVLSADAGRVKLRLVSSEASGAALSLKYDVVRKPPSARRHR